MEGRRSDEYALHERLLAVEQAASKVYYGPSKGHLSVTNWRQLGEALAEMDAERSRIKDDRRAG